MNDQSRAFRGRSGSTTRVDVDPGNDSTRPLPLTRPRIVRAALRLVDEKGLLRPALPPKRIPAATAVGPHLDGVHRPGRFDYGLDLLLAGLRAKLTHAGEPAATSR